MKDAEAGGYLEEFPVVETDLDRELQCVTGKFRTRGAVEASHKRPWDEPPEDEH